MQYSFELLIRLLFNGNFLSYYAKQITSQRIMHQVKHQSARCIRSRSRRSGELLAAPGDLEERAMKFGRLEFPLVVSVFYLTMQNAFCVLT